MTRVTGTSSGIRVTVYAYERKEGFQCPTCMRLIATDDFLIAHTAAHHPRALKGATS